MSSRRPRAREEDGVLCSLRQQGPAVAQVGAPPGERPPRRAGRCAPCRPCRGRAGAPARSRRPGRSRPIASGAPQAGRVDELDERAVAQAERTLSRRSESSSASTSATFGAGRQPPRPAGPHRRVRNTRRDRGQPEERPHRRELAPDRGRRELRPPPPEVGRVVGEDADVHVVELEPARREPGCELLEIAPVCPPRRIRQRGALQQAFDLLHAEEFATGAEPTPVRPCNTVSLVSNGCSETARLRELGRLGARNF